jgi:glycine cleavage system H lipoate-binding protein
MNESPYEDGWIIKMAIDNMAALDGMMSSADYQKMIE